jgi:peptidoglycan/LPS O-acetylase OafA/YrhL
VCESFLSDRNTIVATGRYGFAAKGAAERERPQSKKTGMAGRQIANLQGLRGIAAFLIVLYHLQPLLNREYGLSLHSNFGVIGVDIFFVLSGFVMFFSNPEPQPAGVQPFLTQRFFRIVPLYWLATLAIIAFFLAGFRPVGLHELSPKIVAQSFAFIPSAFANGRHDLILTVGWTLMFELFFYLAYALTFPLRSFEKSFAVLAAAFVGLSVIGHLVNPLPYLLNFYTSPIMLEFLYGAATARLFLRWKGDVPRWLPSAGLALLLTGFGIVIAEDATGIGVPNKHDARFLILGLPALLVFGGALVMERGGRALKNGFFLELGTASYVLYLFHPLILQMSVKLLRPAVPHSAAIAGIVAIAVCLASAFAIHRWIEAPLLAWSKRLTRRRASVARPTARALAMQATE